MNCVKCIEVIAANSNFCPKCGTNQKTGDLPAAYKEPCTHCGGYGTCTRTKVTMTKRCSCELCISAAEKVIGHKHTDPFPVVPCVVCSGKGFHVIEAARPKQQQGRNNNRNKSGAGTPRGGGKP